jgi:hypothetical protein
MSSHGLRLLSAVVVCCAVSLLPAAAAAGADTTSEYAPAAESRNFANSGGEWTNSSSFDGSCIPPLLCPTITNSFQATGGAQGDGFIRSAFTGVAGVLGVAGTATGTWESPQFSYAGAGGQTPAAVRFTMDRQASVEQLLAVAGNSATYSVQLVDVSAPSGSLTLIDKAGLAGAAAWQAVPAVAVNPARLTPGDRYKIKIDSSYTTGTSVLVTGNADYDNVVLRASIGSGGNGNGGGGGAGSLTASKLLALIQGSLVGPATLTGNRLSVKVRCPAKVGVACRTAVQGLLKKHRPATSTRKAKIAKGKTKRLVLKVKPKALKTVSKRKRLLFKETVRAGKAKATLYKSLKLIRRR